MADFLYGELTYFFFAYCIYDIERNLRLPLGIGLVRWDFNLTNHQVPSASRVRHSTDWATCPITVLCTNLLSSIRCQEFFFVWHYPSWPYTISWLMLTVTLNVFTFIPWCWNFLSWCKGWWWWRTHFWLNFFICLQSTSTRSLQTKRLVTKSPSSLFTPSRRNHLAWRVAWAPTWALDYTWD